MRSILLGMLLLLSSQSAIAAKADSEMPVTALDWAVLKLNVELLFVTDDLKFAFRAVYPNTVVVDVVKTLDSKNKRHMELKKAFEKIETQEVYDALKRYGVTEKVNVKYVWKGIELSEEELQEVQDTEYFLQKNPKVLD